MHGAKEQVKGWSRIHPPLRIKFAKLLTSTVHGTKQNVPGDLIFSGFSTMNSRYP